VSANPMVLNTVLDSCSDVAEFGRIAEATIANSHGDEDAVQVRKIARFTCAPENHGERLWVSKAMGELCAAAAATLPEELAGTTLSADDLPWPSGTVVFETPLFVVPEGFVEYALGEGPIDVIQWSSDSQGVFMVAWQSRHGSEPLGFPRYLPRFAFQLPYGLIPEGVDDDIAFRRLVSLWSMLRQRIALTEKRQAPRPSWKRWTRKHGHEPKDIIVVTLRRPTIHPVVACRGRTSGSWVGTGATSPMGRRTRCAACSGSHPSSRGQKTCLLWSRTKSMRGRDEHHPTRQGTAGATRCGAQVSS